MDAIWQVSDLADEDRIREDNSTAAGGRVIMPD